jgi:hypothetical protein
MTSIPEPFGPVYPVMGPKVAKFRRIPRSEKTREQHDAYAQAIEDKIRELQRNALQRELPTIRPRCASGTWHTTGAEIERAIRQQQAHALQAYVVHLRFGRHRIDGGGFGTAINVSARLTGGRPPSA